MKRFLPLLVLIALLSCKSGGGGGGELEPAPGKPTINIEDFLHGQEGDTASVNHFIAFRNDARPDWINLIDHGHFIRYSLHQIEFPGAGNLETIVSDNFNASDIAYATKMERSFYAKGWGRVSPLLIFGSPPVNPGEVEHCRDFGWNAPPGPNLVLRHCQ